MATEYIVVDGSNIATEGRSAPSLAQLEEAVSELRREYPDAEVTVVVDATFAHRVDPSELERFEKAALAGEYVHPPAGAIGRGDAFLLRISQKIDAVVLSNDSFQEFHGEHPWLFDRGRLLGATPVPGVGWIFTPRSPVRGPKSRRAVKDSEREKRKISKAIEVATKEAVSPPRPAPAREAAKRAKKEGAASSAGQPAEPSGRRRRTGGGTAAAAAVNDPLTFISFIADHPLGAEVSGRVESYTSHGAAVFVGSVQCYIPLANMAVPPPRSAREVLKRGEERTFVVTALDPLRRGVELAVPGIAVVSGRPSEEMIAAEVRLAKKAAAPAKKAAKKAASPTKKAAKKAAAATKKAATPPPSEEAAVPPSREAGPAAPEAPARTRSRRAAKKKAAEPSVPAAEAPEAAPARRPRRAPAKKSPAEPSRPAKKAAAKKSPAGKAGTEVTAESEPVGTATAPTKKAAAKKAPAAVSQPPRKQPTKRAAGTTKAATKSAQPAGKEPAKRTSRAAKAAKRDEAAASTPAAERAAEPAEASGREASPRKRAARRRTA